MATPIVVKVLTDMSQFAFGLSDAESKFSQFNVKMGQLGATLTTTVSAPLIKAGKDAIDAAAEMESLESRTSAAFGKNADSIIKWSSTLLYEFGVGKDEALDFSSKLAFAFDSMGVPMGEGTDMIKDLTARAGDLASAFDTDVKDATLAIGAAFRGEYEQLENFGIQLKQSEVNTRALAIAQKDGREEITAADKALATYELIMERSSLQAGDFARTTGELGNQTRVAKEEFEILQRELGQKLLPVAKDVMEVVRDLLGWFLDLPPSVQENIVKVGALATALGPALTGLASLIKILDTLATNRKYLALTGLIGALVLAYEEIDWFNHEVNMTTYKTAQEINTILDLVQAMINQVLGFFEATLDGMANIFEAIGWDSMAERFRNAADNVGSMRQRINDEIDQVKRNVDIFFEGINNVSPTIAEIRSEIRSLQDEIYATYPGGQPSLDPQAGAPPISGPGMTSGGITEYDQGGVVSGPVGSPQLILAHGGETILPTHKAGFDLGSIANAITAGVQQAGGIGNRENNYGPITVMSNSPDDMLYQLNERQRLRNLVTNE